MITILKSQNGKVSEWKGEISSVITSVIKITCIFHHSVYLFRLFISDCVVAANVTRSYPLLSHNPWCRH